MKLSEVVGDGDELPLAPSGVKASAGEGSDAPAGLDLPEEGLDDPLTFVVVHPAGLVGDLPVHPIEQGRVRGHGPAGPDAGLPVPQVAGSEVAVRAVGGRPARTAAEQ